MLQLLICGAAELWLYIIHSVCLVPNAIPCDTCTFSFCNMEYMHDLLLDCVQSDTADETLNSAISCGSSLAIVDARVTCDLVITGVGAVFPLHM